MRSLRKVKHILDRILNDFYFKVQGIKRLLIKGINRIKRQF
mgnify:CR=1 FL=1